VLIEDLRDAPRWLDELLCDSRLTLDVNRLQSLTPPFSDNSTSCRADRPSDPTPNDTLFQTHREVIIGSNTLSSIIQS
jgi:hypothetical protein